MFPVEILLTGGLLIGIFVFAVYQMPLLLWSVLFAGFGGLLLNSGDTFWHKGFAILAALSAIGCAFLAVPVVRRRLCTTVIFNLVRKRKAHISTLEKQALSAGQAGFEAGFFTGQPDWDAIRSLPAQQLTEEEQSFIDGPIKEFCQEIDDWDIRSQKRIPESVWDLAKEHRLSGLRVSKKWGGHGFSFQAQSLILNKVASHSVDASILVELPTSLYPDELIEEYGTPEQKEFYLTRLAQGKEVVAFAVTGVQGSDVGGMHDTGVVTYGLHEGKKTLGLKLNFDKRYITFAPKASLLVVAFSLQDPDSLLDQTYEPSISLALIPMNHPGIKAEQRHFPTGLGFPHGPIQGNDVFIPLEWIIGGKAGIGLGWKMIMQCLFVGRCLALPSISVGTIKTAFRTSTAYAVVRRQFGLPISTFAGVKESITHLSELTYVSEAARSLAATTVDSGVRPLAVSSLMKYQITEHARQAINHALDIHAGRGACDGPANYLLSGYNAVPIGVTVEGANIVSRSVITFAQGVIQCHPFLRTELESCEHEDFEAGARSFDRAFTSHVSLLISSISRSVIHAVTGSYFAKAPRDVSSSVARWYRFLRRYSCSFAVLSDVTIIFLGAELKKQQRLGGRLADVLSELYLLTSVLKRYEDDGCREEDYPVVALSLENGLYRVQEALLQAIRNFPIRPVRWLLRGIVFPLGAWRRTAGDELGEKVAQSVLQAGPLRERMTNHMYYTTNPADKIGRLEVAFKAALEAESVYRKIRVATRAGLLKKDSTQVKQAEELGIISTTEARLVREAERTAADAIAVNVFEQKVYKPS